MPPETFASYTPVAFALSVAFPALIGPTSNCIVGKRLTQGAIIVQATLRCAR